MMMSLETQPDDSSSGSYIYIDNLVHVRAAVINAKWNHLNPVEQ